jgi:hypothetical protein
MFDGSASGRDVVFHDVPEALSRSISGLSIEPSYRSAAIVELRYGLTVMVDCLACIPYSLDQVNPQISANAV